MIIETLERRREVQASTRSASRRVLIVDDDADLRAMIADVLAIAGYETDQARSGVEAVALARGIQPDVMTLDLRLPRLDGNGVLRELGESSATRRVAVVIVSSDTSELRATPQVVAVLEKPFELDRFLGTIAAAMSAVADHPLAIPA